MKSFDDDTVIHPVKYEREVALIWGPLTDHSIALFSYAYGYCVCLSVSVGSINSGNVNRFLADISQQYPPRRSLLLLEWAKSPHFSSGNCNLPSFSHKALLYDVIHVGLSLFCSIPWSNLWKVVRNLFT